LLLAPPFSVESNATSHAQPTPPLHWAASVMPHLLPVSRFGRISQSVIGGHGRAVSFTPLAGL